MTDMVKCPVPNSCLTINPDGTLAPCCQASLPFERDDKFISLQTTDSLLNFFNSPFLNNSLFFFISNLLNSFFKTLINFDLNSLRCMLPSPDVDS